MTPITGLEAIATPLVILTGLGTIIAALVAIARLKASRVETPLGNAITAIAILATGTACLGLATLGATLADPQTNHMPVGAWMWTISTLIPAMIPGIAAIKSILCPPTDKETPVGAAAEDKQKP